MQQDILLTALPAECTDAGRLARSFAVGGHRFCTFRFRRLAASLAAFACAGLCFAQQFVTLDAALVNSLAYLQGKIPKGSKVLLLNFPAPTKTLSKYLIDELTAHIVNSGSFVVVERNNLEALQKELNFQMSGEVSDETAVSIGRKLGAQSIISGSVEPLGDAYRLHIQATEVESAAIQGMQNTLVMQDAVFAALSGRKRSLTGGRGGDGQSDDSWKYRRLHFGLRPGASLHFYNTDGGAYDGCSAEQSVSADIAVQMAYQFSQRFSLQTELVLTADEVRISRRESARNEYGGELFAYDAAHAFNWSLLEIPVLAAFTYWQRVFSVGGYAGAYFPVPLNPARYADRFTGTSGTGDAALPIGLAAGGSAGIKLGEGVLFADARVLLDLGYAHFSGAPDGDLCKRRTAAFGIGYEIGFINY
jgi:hypothetical protein